MGLFGVLIFYLLIQTVTQGVLGAALPDNPEAPLAVTAQRLMGDFGFQLIIIGGIISIFRYAQWRCVWPRHVWFMRVPRTGFSQKCSVKIHSKFKTPTYSILLFAGLITFFACIGNFRQLALVSSSAILIVYLAVVLATIKIKLSKKGAYKNAFNIPGGLIVPIMAIGVIGWFLSHTSMDEILAMLIFFVIFYCILPAIFSKTSEKKI